MLLSTLSLAQTRLQVGDEGRVAPVMPLTGALRQKMLLSGSLQSKVVQIMPKPS